MLKNRISPKSIVLVVYLAIIILEGVVFIPAAEVWGPDDSIHGYTYTFLFNLVKDSTEVNGFNVAYKIDIIRLLYTIGITTLIAAVVWALLSLWEKEDSTGGSR
ncbi:hypothetical protein [Paenibacillus tarimensis]|uniref:hypothetical protein n=1 Tax=Paenibacillus tarimensis TaxID=416012 RepID=UPI001F491B93|nr:hypothetical protein [Paenibacillus tarimensis]MCF2946083.1 hypothetical protein [Paenibacillus tarimensis]